MTEHKFTDDEVIRALECCIDPNGANCKECPYDICCTVVESIMLTDVLNLINRQKAEIERLREIRDLCNTTILEKNEQIEKLKISDASKEECTIRQHGEIKELKAEIESLKETLHILHEDTHLIVDKRTAEAIKKFAERLKENCYRNGDGEGIIFDYEIDDLVKEMTEGKE